jgi:SagB-type dehydrogenase family enzyme
MKYQQSARVWAACIWIMALPIVLFATNRDTLYLPAPQTEGGKPLMQVLKERRSTRSFRDEDLSDAVLSNLLWAGFGVNRSESGKRTAPSARNWQEIDIYVTLETGCFLYDAVRHALVPVLAEDVRAYTGSQSFVAQAPVNLVYVADFSRMHGAGMDQKRFYSAADAGFISQNVYLFCASEGLATVVRGLVDRETLAEKMALRTDQEIILAQSVGYPDLQE